MAINNKTIQPVGLIKGQIAATVTEAMTHRMDCFSILLIAKAMDSADTVAKNPSTIPIKER
jgi:hypothetical protein